MNKLKKIISRLKKFILFRIFYPLFYRLCCLRPVKQDKVLFIEVRGEKLDGSFQMILSWLNRKRPNICKNAVYLGWGRCGGIRYLMNCLDMIYEMSDARAVFISEACNVLGAVPKRRETKVVQLWHGCGAFKKFGYSTAEMKWGADRRELEKYPNYKNMDIITVSSPEVAWAYEEAMGVSPDKIYPTGVSRTDIFFRKNFRKKAGEKLDQAAGQIGNRKVILYAPTFRGELNDARSCEDFPWDLFAGRYGSEAVLLVKHHPFVKVRPQIPENCRDCIFDVTDSMKIEELLCVSDLCISDYSSLVFEYSLMERPMIFFAPDMEDYKDWRGFYYPYEEMTPGPVCVDAETLMEEISKSFNGFDRQKVRDFRDRFMCACDGHATDRIMKLALDE